MEPPREPEEELVARAKREAYGEAARICETQAFGIDGSLPDARGGMFAKKFAANALRGAAGLIRKLADRRKPNADRRHSLGWGPTDGGHRNVNGRVKDRRRVMSKSEAKRRKDS